MDHIFNVDLAVKIGMNAAVVYRNIQFWCEKNRANEKNFHEGFYWTYNSKTAFMELFPYMTYAQIKAALTVLYDNKLIGKGNFNESPYDRTNWYCDLHQKQPLKHNESTGRTEPIDWSPITNRLATDSHSITDSKPDSKPDNKHSAEKISAIDFEQKDLFSLNEGEKEINDKEQVAEVVFPFEEFWEMYGKKEDRKKTESKFKKLKKSELEKIKEFLPNYIQRRPDKKYRKNPLTWLNSE